MISLRLVVVLVSSCSHAEYIMNDADTCRKLLAHVSHTILVQPSYCMLFLMVTRAATAYLAILPTIEWSVRPFEHTSYLYGTNQMSNQTAFKITLVPEGSAKGAPNVLSWL